MLQSLVLSCLLALEGRTEDKDKTEDHCLTTAPQNQENVIWMECVMALHHYEDGLLLSPHVVH
jgi:hypothetical protein